MRVGVTLPTFRDDTLALDVARRAEELGLDGVFVFDHLWPMGAPERPALSAFPMLGAIAPRRAASASARSWRAHRAPARRDPGGRASVAGGDGARALIAGLGTGDAERGREPRLRDPLRPARRAPDGAAPLRGGTCSTPGCQCGWGSRPVHGRVGGGPRACGQSVGRPARGGGRDGTALRGDVGRSVAGDVPEIAQWLEEVAGAGATWAVSAWPESIEAVAEAAAFVR